MEFEMNVKFPFVAGGERLALAVADAAAEPSFLLQFLDADNLRGDKNGVRARRVGNRYFDLAQNKVLLSAFETQPPARDVFAGNDIFSKHKAPYARLEIRFGSNVLPPVFRERRRFGFELRHELGLWHRLRWRRRWRRIRRIGCFGFPTLLGFKGFEFWRRRCPVNFLARAFPKRRGSAALAKSDDPFVDEVYVRFQIAVLDCLAVFAAAALQQHTAFLPLAFCHRRKLNLPEVDFRVQEGDAIGVAFTMSAELANNPHLGLFVGIQAA